MKKSFWNLFCDIDNLNDKYFDPFDMDKDADEWLTGEPIKYTIGTTVYPTPPGPVCSLCGRENCVVYQITEVILQTLGNTAENEKIEVDFNNLSIRKIRNDILIAEYMSDGTFYNYFNEPEMQADYTLVSRIKKAMIILLEWFMDDVNGVKELHAHRIFLRQ